MPQKRIRLEKNSRVEEQAYPNSSAVLLAWIIKNLGKVRWLRELHFEGHFTLDWTDWRMYGWTSWQAWQTDKTCHSANASVGHEKINKPAPASASAACHDPQRSDNCTQKRAHKKRKEKKSEIKKYKLKLKEREKTNQARPRQVKWKPKQSH